MNLAINERGIHWPPAIERAARMFDVFHPALAHQIEPTISELMQPLLARADHLPTWNLSQLTADGFPFEITFTTANDGLRYTVEIASPGIEAEKRLRQARDILLQLDIRGFDEETYSFLQELQAGAPLKFGAWVGARHKPAGRDFKIYVEVPSVRAGVATAYLNRHLEAPVFIQDRAIELHMIGFYPASGALEFYFSVHGMKPWEIVALMHPVGLASRHEEVFNHFQWAHGRPIYQQLPGPVFGFSYSLTPHHPDHPPVFSLYTFAETLFGSDATARRKLLRYFSKTGANMGCYEAMSAPLVAEESPKNQHFHGLFGVAIGEGIPPVAHIGLRPPPEAGQGHD